MQETETQYIKNKVRKEIAVTIWQRNSFRILPFHAVLTLDYFLLNIVKSSAFTHRTRYGARTNYERKS